MLLKPWLVLRTCALPGEIDMRLESSFLSMLLAMLFVASHPAFAGAPHMDCSKPFIYPESDVNTVVLPYSYAGGNQRLNETGRRISLLIQADTLLHIMPYGRIASVQLEPSPGAEAECEPQVVLGKLLGKNPNYREIKPGKGLVLIWGLIYEEGGDIFLKTFATALRRDAPDSAELKFGKWTFVTSPSARVVAFPPRKISHSMLNEIEAKYSSADRVYSDPSEDAQSRALPRANCPTCSPGETQGYYVDRKQGDWLHVRWFGANNDSDAGWIRAQSDLAGHSLDSFMPELNFIRASVGYLAFRMAPTSPEAPRLRDLATAGFKQYLKSDEQGQAEVASAVALELCGIMRVLGGGSPENWNEAIGYFETAHRLVPENPEARNVLAVGHIYQDWIAGTQLERSKERAQELIDATLLKPNDPVPVKNLASYYQLLLPKAREVTNEPSPKALSLGDIQKRLDKIAALHGEVKAPDKTPEEPSPSPY